MFQFILKTAPHHHHPLHQTIIPNPNLKSLTTLSNSNSSTTLINYLTDTLGFTSESALQLSNKIHQRLSNYNNNNKPFNSVHSLFENYGFAPTHIAKIIATCPAFLFSNPEKTLKPKLDFLAHTGISGDDLVSTITVNPRILERSLSQQIEPCIGFLKSFLGSTSAVISQFNAKRGTSVVLKFSPSMAKNVEYLRQRGVPQCNIVRMITMQPQIVAREAKLFSDAVREAEKLGFDPSSMMFIHGVCTLSSMKKEKWVSKIAVFRSFGWSEAEFWALFLKQPPLLRTSEERLRRALDFFVNEMRWGVVDIAKYPTMLCLSFEKRVLPRSSVLQILSAKGLITKKTTIGKAFLLSEDKFVSEFLKVYEEHAPEVIEMYQKELHGL